MAVPLVVSNHQDLQDEAEAFGSRFVHAPITPDSRTHAEQQQLALLVERASNWWCWRNTCRPSRARF